jgi:hypothetical protein
VLLCFSDAVASKWQVTAGAEMFLEFFCHLFYLQYFYDSVASKWQVTAGAEEIFCAFLYALKAWFMVMCVCVCGHLSM